MNIKISSYIDLNENVYVLNNELGNIGLILQDSMIVKLDYQTEKGVTRIEFSGLVEYMKLNYTIQDITFLYMQI